jgi:ribonuclease HI
MGWAFYDGCLDDGTPHVTAYRLEEKGPFDHDSSETNNRAELRAVIDALRNQFWPGEGFHTMVIAINSQYVVGGATAWVEKWIENNWMKSSKEERKNRDLWEDLLGEVERCNDQGMAVKLWEIPKEWNTVAHDAAYKVAREAPK